MSAVTRQMCCLMPCAPLRGRCATSHLQLMCYARIVFCDIASASVTITAPLTCRAQHPPVVIGSTSDSVGGAAAAGSDAAVPAGHTAPHVSASDPVILEVPESSFVLQCGLNMQVRHLLPALVLCNRTRRKHSDTRMQLV